MSYTCNECGKAVAQMIPGETHSTCEGHEVSRWAAFDDDELDMLANERLGHIADEAEAELKRRRVSDREPGGSS